MKSLGCALTLVLLAILVQGPSRSAYAASIVVNSMLPSPGEPGDCTPGEAIQAANSDTAVDACLAGSGADVIELGANATYTLREADNCDPEYGSNGLPIITSERTAVTTCAGRKRTRPA